MNKSSVFESDFSRSAGFHNPFLKLRSSIDKRLVGSGLADRGICEACIGFNIFVNVGFSLFVEDADIHFSGMKVDTAIVLVLLIVKPHNLANNGEVYDLMLFAQLIKTILSLQLLKFEENT